MIDANDPLNLDFKLSVGNFWEASQKHDYGVITAFRDTNGNKGNKERIQYLRLNLRKKRLCRQKDQRFRYRKLWFP